MRPRTLPLALASIFMGGFLAGERGVFRLPIVALAVLTTIFLQILSNLANDYGDSVHGADSAERIGPTRAVQSGVISKEEMRRAMLVCAILAMISGIALILVSFGLRELLLIGVFTVLGAGAVWAAVNYTAGNNPYGYVGLGDLFVFLFFGLAGVLGTYFLQTKSLEPRILLPAISCGLLSVSVLNVNNIRDIASDQLAGKISIPVRIGKEQAVRYNWVLLIGALVCGAVYVFADFRSPFQLIFLTIVPNVVRLGRAVATTPQPDMDPLLKRTVFTTLAFVILFGAGQLLG